MSKVTMSNIVTVWVSGVYFIEAIVYFEASNKGVFCLDLYDNTIGSSICSNVSYYNGFDDSNKGKFFGVIKSFFNAPKDNSHQLVLRMMQSCNNNLSIHGTIAKYKLH